MLHGTKNKAVKNKKQKNSKVKTGAGSSLTLSAFLALGAAVIIYIVLIQFEKNQLSEYEKGTILTANTMISRGTVITAENRDVYFSSKEIEKTLIPEGAVLADSMEDMTAVYDIAPGTYLMSSMFEEISMIESEYVSPKIIGFKAEDLAEVVGGVLRTGDRVDIYLLNTLQNEETVGIQEEEYEAVLQWENVYIQQAFDSSGVNITPDDSALSAQRFNIYLEEEDIPDFLAALEKGILRMVKRCD